MYLIQFFINTLGAYIIWWLVYNNKKPSKNVFRNLILILLAVTLIKIKL